MTITHASPSVEVNAGLAAFWDYTRCPAELLHLPMCHGSAGSDGFFRYGPIVLYGRAEKIEPARRPDGTLADVTAGVEASAGRLHLPFNPATVVENLRRERYIDNRLPGGEEARLTVSGVVRSAYYAVRPALPVAVRKYAQRLALRNWSRQPFPKWPNDMSVDNLMRAIFARLLDVHGTDEMPFIWFWPHGHTACAIMTHDVETAAGRDFTAEMMRMEAEVRIHSAFEIVPEVRYEVPESYLDEIRSGGCEICVHGLNHDGRLFLNEALFRERARRINAYARRYGAEGFRSPVMYRRIDWFDALEFSYDMSVPNVAHLDPQRGGCCTVMPYTIGSLVELPLTTVQDYSLYHILRQMSMDLWRRQCDAILEHHGLMSFIVHPDYTIAHDARRLFADLLRHLATLRDQQHVWVTLPREVNRWWRQRSGLSLVRDGHTWRIVGDGAERAVVAVARRDSDGKVRYDVRA